MPPVRPVRINLVELFGIVGFILGSVLGSFILVLADRSLSNQSFWGRSYCVHCKHTLRWYDLLPILSYIFLKGHCRYCKKGIKIDYLAVEVIMGLLVGFLFWSFDFAQDKLFIFLPDLIFRTFFITVLAVLFITDLKKMLIPDRIVLPSLGIGIIFIILITIIKVIYLYYFLNQTKIGQLLLPPHSDYFQRHAMQAAQTLFWGILMAILIGGFFWGLIIITKGKGMGGGDVKLGAFIGLVLGFPLALLAIFLAFILGAIFSIFLILAGKKHLGQSIPFGPFLVLGSLIALFWGGQIINWDLDRWKILYQ